MKKAFAILFCCLAIVLAAQSIVAATNNNDFLYKPTGKFQVGFRDFLWVNTNICPDPTAPKGSAKYFSKNNTSHCREVLVRIYYPAKSKQALSSPYPQYVINKIKKRLKKINSISLQKYIKQHIGNLEQLKIHAKANMPTSPGSYPVIIFSPGAIDNSLEYCNLLINLTSHGYIVVAINDTFLTTVRLPNGTVIAANTKMNSISHIVELYKMKFLDMQFVYNKLKQLNQQNKLPLLSVMNMQEVGVLGHSGGASAAVAMARTHADQIKTAAALDAPNQTTPQTNLNLKKAGVTFPKYFDIFSSFNIPVLQMHSSYAQYFLGAPNQEFKLGKNNYLATITKGTSNDYFKHMDFSDYPLFENVPFIQHIDYELQKHGQKNPIFPSWGYGTISENAAIKTVSTYLLSFFKKFLNGSNQSKYLPGCKPLTDNTTVECGTNN